MSEEDTVDTSSSSCASCGIAEVDDIKLKDCNACDLVRYCSDMCQRNHRSQHEDACKKRAAELRDELLFKQPESTHRGDCPICMIPMPLIESKSVMAACCSKCICDGCAVANMTQYPEHKCPFCREPCDKEITKRTDKQRMKRIEMNDPDAICYEGRKQFRKGDYESAFEYFTKAAQLGDAEAHCRLALWHKNGKGVEKDKGKGIYHLEEAVIGGHPGARKLLGFKELLNDNAERAVRHWIISAGQGDDGSIEELMEGFKAGYVSKEDLATALRAHQAAVDATKSPQREAAEEFRRKWPEL